MQILLANDDGIEAPGLAALYKQLVQLGDVTVVAPADARSGVGHSITFRRPLEARRVTVDGLFTGYSVMGSPADCVKLAVLKLVESPVDLVVSGMNDGANVGINVYYSGTVAAAMEGAFLGLPAIAVSLARELPESAPMFDLGAQYAVEVIKRLLPLPCGDVININIPLLSRGRPRGVHVVPQSSTGFDEHYIEETGRDGIRRFTLAGDHHLPDANETDLSGIEAGYITITALTPDMTQYRRTLELERVDWACPMDPPDA
ncbi:MAG TPA: 5'/3'-nucleotidase SurE [Phycisphaerales bacterium]|nr:5'/3'-nucleotidase SurE [Phycisphaerales bacterium]